MKIILNCAMSADGKISLPSRCQTRISNREDIERVHLLRNSVDAILVGIGTVLADDPKLTVNEKYVSSPKMPLRIVLDSSGRIPSNAEILGGSAKTLIVTNESCKRTFPRADVIRMGEKRVDLLALKKYLEDIGVRTLLVEGGSTVMWSFLSNGLADELSVFVGSMIIGGDRSPTLADGEGFASIEEVRRLKLADCERIGDGVLLRYEVIK